VAAEGERRRGGEGEEGYSENIYVYKHTYIHTYQINMVNIVLNQIMNKYQVNMYHMDQLKQLMINNDLMNNQYMLMNLLY
jgi:hypothetical protein